MQKQTHYSEGKTRNLEEVLVGLFPLLLAQVHLSAAFCHEHYEGDEMAENRTKPRTMPRMRGWGMADLMPSERV